MLEAILSHLNNWFAAPGGKHRGTFRIADGVLRVDFLGEGQYFRIRGSVYNDGLHQAGTSSLSADGAAVQSDGITDEAGAAVPPSISDEVRMQSGGFADEAEAAAQSDGITDEAGAAVPPSISDGAPMQSGGFADETDAEKDILRDETFTGEIWALAVPPAIVALAREIAAWREKNPETDRVSESFGGYSYSRGGAGGAVGGWQAAFASRLSPYRRAYDD